MSCHCPGQTEGMPPGVPMNFRVFGLSGEKWNPASGVRRNRGCFVRLKIGRRLSGVRFKLDRTWGGRASNLYAFYVS